MIIITIYSLTHLTWNRQRQARYEQLKELPTVQYTIIIIIIHRIQYVLAIDFLPFMNKVLSDPDINFYFCKTQFQNTLRALNVNGKWKKSDCCGQKIYIKSSTNMKWKRMMRKLRMAKSLNVKTDPNRRWKWMDENTGWFKAVETFSIYSCQKLWIHFISGSLGYETTPKNHDVIIQFPRDERII